MIAISSHCYKETQIGSLKAEKIAEEHLLYAFKIVFPVPLFPQFNFYIIYNLDVPVTKNSFQMTPV